MVNIKKNIRVGLGLALIGTEKIPKLIRQMEKDGELGKTQAKKIIDKVWDITKKEAKELDRSIDTKTKLKLMRFALKAKKEANEFKIHLEDLEDMVSELIDDKRTKGIEKTKHMHKKIKKKVKDTKDKMVKHLNSGINNALDELMKD